MKLILIVLLLFYGSSTQLFCQTQRIFTSNFNGWFTYNGDHKFSKKWGIHLEAQFRRNQIVVKPQQLLLRTGINYHLSNFAFVTAGYCFVNTYPYGEFASKCIFGENRIWEQLQLKNQFGKFENITRYRLEQRFVNSPVLINSSYVAGDAIYSNRFRFLSRISLPLKGTEIVDKSFYISAYDEVFIAFGKNVGYNLLDQNRAYISIGYKMPKLGRIEIGYLNQLIFKSDGIKVENNHTLQVGISSNINFYKTKS